MECLVADQDGRLSIGPRHCQYLSLFDDGKAKVLAGSREAVYDRFLSALCVTDKGSVVGKGHLFNSTVFTFVRRVKFNSFPSWRVRWRRPSSLQNWKACWRMREKQGNRVGAHPQPCFSPLRVLNGRNQESCWRNIITKNIHTHKRDERKGKEFYLSV